MTIFDCSGQSKEPVLRHNIGKLTQSVAAYTIGSAGSLTVFVTGELAIVPKKTSG